MTFNVNIDKLYDERVKLVEELRLTKHRERDLEERLEDAKKVRVCHEVFDGHLVC